MHLELDILVIEVLVKSNNTDPHPASTLYIGASNNQVLSLDSGCGGQKSRKSGLGFGLPTPAIIWDKLG